MDVQHVTIAVHVVGCGEGVGKFDSRNLTRSVLHAISIARRLEFKASLTRYDLRNVRAVGVILDSYSLYL